MISFSDLLPEIKKRPTLYLSRYSIFDFQSFYYGYDFASNQLGLPKSEKDQEFEQFLSGLRDIYKIETTQSWASLILFHSVDEKDYFVTRPEEKQKLKVCQDHPKSK